MTKIEDEFDEWIKEKKPDFKFIKNGFPDRVLFNGKDLVFIEIKSKNDQLKSSQKKMLSVLGSLLPVFIARQTREGFELLEFTNYFAGKYNKKKGRSTPLPLRLTSDAELGVHFWMMEKGVKNRNRAINEMILRCYSYERNWKLIKETLLKFTFDFDVKLGELKDK